MRLRMKAMQPLQMERGLISPNDVSLYTCEQLTHTCQHEGGVQHLVSKSDEKQDWTWEWHSEQRRLSLNLVVHTLHSEVSEVRS
jgi:hypothetical protein